MGVTHSIIKNQKPYIELQKVVTKLNDGYVKSGFPDSGDVGKATRNKANAKPYENISEVAQVAVWNEFGTDKIPSRPFFRNAINGNREKIFEMAGKFSDLAMVGKITVEQAFENLGLYMQSIIRKSIRSNIAPPNAKSIERAKNSSKTLIDSGQMINSVTYVKMIGKHAGTGKPEVA